jgi:hypothetical protein
VDSQKVTQIKSSNVAKAPAQSYFLVPLSLDIPTEKFKESVPTDFETVMRNPSIHVQIKGKVVGQKMLIIRKAYDINYSEQVSLQDINNLSDF